MKKNQWVVNKSTGIVRHSSGLTLSLERGAVVNIDVIPPSITTRDLPSLIDDGLLAYRQHKTETLPVAPVHVARNPVLALKKKN